MTEQIYEDFFDISRQIVDEAERRKEEGENDYNPLSILRKPHEEVGLHSSFIASLLDPKGTHYQKSRFLKLFLKAVGLEEFGLLADNAFVKKEHKNIDIYISDGVKHIIIENKIYAREQDKQIERYINTIKDENSEIEGENIYVLYLSLDKKDPSPWSTGIYTITGNKLEADGYKVPYKAIKYGDEIRAWIESSKKDIEPRCFLKNIHQSLCWYEDVIDMLEKRYKGVMMELKNHLKKKENYKVSLEIANMFQSVREEICQDFFNSKDFDRALKEVFPENKWRIDNKSEQLNKKWYPPIKIFKKGGKENFCFGFEFGRDGYYSGGFGITRINENISLEDARAKLAETQNVPETHKVWWIAFEWLPDREPDGDFAKEIQVNGFTHTDFKNRVQKLKEEWEHILATIDS